MRRPDFDNMRRILNRERPKRPTLFEFFLNTPLYLKLAGSDAVCSKDINEWNQVLVRAFTNAGYDYAMIHPPQEMTFKTNEPEHAASISLNAYHTIFDLESFNNYEWPEPDKADYSIYEKLTPNLPEGMKIIVCGPGGVLENVIRLVGYDNMCLMTLDNPELLEQIFAEVGSRLVRHYELAARFDTVGALMSNDDWGFNSQTMLSPADFEHYLFPWHRRIAEVCHKAGKPVILHSCGNLEKVMDVIIDDIGYDGKHSYEDNILPVEEAYERWHKRIAILGGIDLDFVCRSSPDAIRERSRKMLERSADRGSYGLGSGNSIPEYVPDANYFAMTGAATEQDQ